MRDEGSESRRGKGLMFAAVALLALAGGLWMMLRLRPSPAGEDGREYSVRPDAAQAVSGAGLPPAETGIRRGDEVGPGRRAARYFLSVAQHADGLPDLAPGVSEESALEGLWDWVRDYYKTHDEWILVREPFKDGPVLETVLPTHLSNLREEGPGRTRLEKTRMKGGGTQECLQVENKGMEYHFVRVAAPTNLPPAFAVEVDMKPLAIFPQPGRKTVDVPFLFDGYRDPSEGAPSWILLSDLPKKGAQTVPGTVRAVANLGEWSQYRVDYFRVGKTRNGETIYEIRLPTAGGGEIRLSGKRNALFHHGIRESRLILGETRFRALVIPPSLERPEEELERR